MNEQKTITIFTDGACSGNPGPTSAGSKSGNRFCVRQRADLRIAGSKSGNRFCVRQRADLRIAGSKSGNRFCVRQRAKDNRPVQMR